MHRIQDIKICQNMKKLPEKCFLPELWRNGHHLSIIQWFCQPFSIWDSSQTASSTLRPQHFSNFKSPFFAPAIISSSSLDCFPLIRLIWRPFFQNNNPGMNEAVQILQPKTMPFQWPFPRLKIPVGLLGRFWQILEQQPQKRPRFFSDVKNPDGQNLRCFMVILLMDKNPKQWPGMTWLVNGIFIISTGFLAGFLNHQQYPLMISDIPWPRTTSSSMLGRFPALDLGTNWDRFFWSEWLFYLLIDILLQVV